MQTTEKEHVLLVVDSTAHAESWTTKEYLAVLSSFHQFYGYKRMEMKRDESRSRLSTSIDIQNSVSCDKRHSRRVNNYGDLSRTNSRNQLVCDACYLFRRHVTIQYRYRVFKSLILSEPIAMLMWLLTAIKRVNNKSLAFQHQYLHGFPLKNNRFFLPVLSSRAGWLSVREWFFIWQVE